MKSLTKGNPLKVVLLFALPLYIGQLFQLLYGVVDTRIIGSIMGDHSLAAVGATASLSETLVEFLNGIIAGFGIIIATYFGAEDRAGMRKAISGTVVMGTVFTVLLSALCIIFLPQIMVLLRVDADLTEDATQYIRIIIIGLLASALYNISASILRAIGDSMTPLFFLVGSNLVNILLDVLFIGVFHLGVTGAAVATVISQLISAIVCFIYMRKRYPEIRLTFKDLLPNWKIYKEMIPTGLSMGFMISFVTIGSIALQTSINSFGANTIVAHTTARRITVIFLTPYFVLGTALATYCGQNLGAKEYGRIKKGIIQTILACFIWYIFANLVVYTLSPRLVKSLTATNEKEIIDTAVKYLRINSLFYILPAFICVLRNSMQGFGDKKTPLISSLIELGGKVLIAFLLAPKIGYMGIIVSEPIVWSVMTVPLLIGTLMNPVIKGNKKEAV